MAAREPGTGSGRTQPCPQPTQSAGFRRWIEGVASGPEARGREAPSGAWLRQKAARRASARSGRRRPALHSPRTLPRTPGRRTCCRARPARRPRRSSCGLGRGRYGAAARRQPRSYRRRHGAGTRPRQRTRRPASLGGRGRPGWRATAACEAHIRSRCSAVTCISGMVWTLAARVRRPPLMWINSRDLPWRYFAERPRRVMISSALLRASSGFLDVSALRTQ